MAGDRLEAGGPIGQLHELRRERVLVVARLLERAPVELLRPCPPSAVAIAADLTGLDLEDEDPAYGIADDDVRLAVADGAALAQEPLDVVEHQHRRRQDAPKAFGHSAFGDLAAGRRRSARCVRTSARCVRTDARRHSRRSATMARARTQVETGAGIHGRARSIASRASRSGVLAKDNLSPGWAPSKRNQVISIVNSANSAATSPLRLSSKVPDDPRSGAMSGGVVSARLSRAVPAGNDIPVSSTRNRVTPPRRGPVVP